MWRRGKLAFALIAIQFFFVATFTLCAHYGKEADASDASHNYAPAARVYGEKFNRIATSQYVFDEFLKFLVLVLGMSMTFVNEYTLSGMGLTFLTTAIVLQLSLTSRLLLLTDKRVIVDVSNMMKSCSAVLSVSLANMSVVGKLSLLQLVFFVIAATLAYEVNLFATEKLIVHDLFPSIRVLMFGSFFGFGASAGCRKDPNERIRLSTSPNNQFFVLCSIVLAFCTWPSVFASFSSGDKQHRIIMNTVLSLTAAVVTSFASASLTNTKNRFDVRLVQSGVTGGAVAISAVAVFMVYPAGALLIGSAGAVIAIFTLLFVTPCITRKLRAPDYFHVVSSYCLPSLFSALLSILYSGLASEKDYGLTMYEIFPGRSPKANTTDLEEITHLLPRIRPGEGRSATDETIAQLATVLITLVTSLATGTTAGLCTRFKFLDPLDRTEFLSDQNNWHMPASEVLVLGCESNCEMDAGENAESIEIAQVVRVRSRSAI